MPEQIRCPSCDATLRVPETLLGKKVKCPKCQTAFTAAADTPGEPDEGIVNEPATPASGRRPALPDDDGGIVNEPSPRASRRRSDDADDEPPPEDEGEDEDRPRRRRRRRGGRGSVEAEAAVAGPAVALMVLGGLDLVLIAVNVLLRLFGVGMMAAGGAGGRGADSDMMANMVGGIIGSVIGLAFAVVILLGAVKMKKLESYGLCMTACILAMLPCGNCCLLGLPFGIWGLVVLNKPEVKEAFS
jgi:predicted Zn finger-like uncharacterized protein